MNDTNQVYADIVAHFAKGGNRRVVFAAQGVKKQTVLSPSDLPKIKPEGSGLRFGKLFIFACQVRFARIA
jgi:hypothetical protein